MAAALVLAAVAVLVQAAPADERSRMSVPPYTVFQGMLRFAEEQDADKLQRSLGLLAPVLAEQDRAFGPAVRRQLTDDLRSPERDVLLRAVRALVARDVVVLLRGLAGANRDRGRTLMRTAALEWRLVEPAALQADLRVAYEISAQLRDLSEVVEAGDLGGSGRAVSQSEKALLGLFTAR